jgi:2-polyprenyl-3-methyl-5-hydroxy-6-metoxy-1,4-benzoquinol methylase
MNPQIEAAQKIYIRNKNMLDNKQLESISGIGSSMGWTKACRSFISTTLKTYNIKSISDCPCGDFHWLQHVDMKHIEYTGYDVVEELIETNKEKFPDKNFKVFDAINEMLPKTDLIICRDFLFHLHEENILIVLNNFKASGSTLLMTTNFDDLKENTDYDARLNWGYRPINLEIEPYNLTNRIDSVTELQDRQVNLYRL